MIDNNVADVMVLNNSKQNIAALTAVRKSKYLSIDARNFTNTL